MAGRWRNCSPRFEPLNIFIEIVFNTPFFDVFLRSNLLFWDLFFIPSTCGKRLLRTAAFISASIISRFIKLRIDEIGIGIRVFCKSTHFAFWVNHFTRGR